MAMRKPSSVGALERAAAAPAAADPVTHDANLADAHERAEHARRAAAPRPVRINLTVPPDVYREFRRWADRLAYSSDVPRVSDPKLLRAMMRACLAQTPEASAMISSWLRFELAGRSDEA